MGMGLWGAAIEFALGIMEPHKVPHGLVGSLGHSIRRARIEHKWLASDEAKDPATPIGQWKSCRDGVLTAKDAVKIAKRALADAEFGTAERRLVKQYKAALAEAEDLATMAQAREKAAHKRLWDVVAEQAAVEERAKAAAEAEARRVKEQKSAADALERAVGAEDDVAGALKRAKDALGE